MQKRIAIANLKKFAITLTTSFECKHGISGHLFEMVEYFYHFHFQKNISTSILISDGTTYEEFFKAITDKYDFSEKELEIILKSTFFYFKPMSIVANTLLITNGSLRMHNCDLLVKKIVMFRCNEDVSEYINKNILILQDYDVYEPMKNSMHYKKKILFSKFKKLTPKKPNIGMFYATSNSRAMSFDDINIIIKKHLEFEKFIVLTDKQMEVPERCEVLIVPIENLLDSFGTYIYTNASSHIDCSPRFIAECKHYNKDLIFELNGKKDKGLETRIHDMNFGDIKLKETDDIYSKI